MSNNIRKTFLIFFFFGAAFISLILSLNYKNAQDRLKQNALENQRSQQPVTPEIKQNLAENGIFEYNGTIESILDIGTPVRCEFYSSEGDNSMKGVTYTDTVSLRSELISNKNSVISTSNTILTNNNYYVWQTGAIYGIMLQNDMYVESSPSVKTKSSGFSVNYTFKCNEWASEDNMFWIPEYIQFLNMTQSINTIKDNPCVICDSIEEPNRKRDCVNSLKCN